MNGYSLYGFVRDEEEACRLKHKLEDISLLQAVDLAICQPEEKDGFVLQGEIFAWDSNLLDNIKQILAEEEDFEIKAISWGAESRAVKIATKNPAQISATNQKISQPQKLQELFLKGKSQSGPKIETKDFSLAHKSLEIGEAKLLPYDEDFVKDGEWGKTIGQYTNPNKFVFSILYRGEKVGKMSRILLYDNLGQAEEVRLDSLYIDPNKKTPKGLGTALQRGGLELYKNMGIKMASVTAVEVGSYVWAKEGFLFDIRKSDYHQFLADLPDLKMAADPGFLSACSALDLWKQSQSFLEFELPRKTYNQFAKQFLDHKTVQKAGWNKKIQTPAEILNLGKDTIIELEGEKVWLGKFLLVNSMKRAFDSAYWCRTGKTLDGKESQFAPPHTPGWSGVKFL